jgi:hypothetical protein
MKRLKKNKLMKTFFQIAVFLGTVLSAYEIRGTHKSSIQTEEGLFILTRYNGASFFIPIKKDADQYNLLKCETQKGYIVGCLTSLDEAMLFQKGCWVQNEFYPKAENVNSLCLIFATISFIENRSLSARDSNSYRYPLQIQGVDRSFAYQNKVINLVKVCPIFTNCSTLKRE